MGMRKALPGLTCFLIAALAGAADKKLPPTAQNANEQVEIAATAYLQKEDIKQVMGAELGPSIVVVEVTFTPKSDKELKLFADDFLLRSYKDGHKSGPFAPSQIAGKGGLMISNTGMGGGMMTGGNPNGPIWGGMGGGRPQRMGGDGGALGNTADPNVNDTQQKDANKEKDNPLLAVLKEKALPEAETAKPVKGMLYFPLDGKHKAKDLTLVYEGQAGKLILEFKEVK
jgi:hypothetical protein